MRSKAPQRVEFAPERPDFLATLLARAENAARTARPRSRPIDRASNDRAEAH